LANRFGLERIQKMNYIKIMAKNTEKNTKNIALSKEDYLKLLELYQKLGEILILKKKKKTTSPLKTLYGIWKGIKVNEEDFKSAKKSLFKTSL
jgi:hypothetical protein